MGNTLLYIVSLICYMDIRIYGDTNERDDQNLQGAFR